MSDKISGKNKVGSVGSMSKTDAVEKARKISEAETVDAVSKVKSAKAVQSIASNQGISGRRSTASMSPEERQKLLRMIDEEADKLEASGLIPKNKKKIIQGAVSMSVKTTWNEEEDKK